MEKIENILVKHLNKMLYINYPSILGELITELTDNYGNDNIPWDNVVNVVHTYGTATESLPVAYNDLNDFKSYFYELKAKTIGSKTVHGVLKIENNKLKGELGENAPNTL